MSAAPVTGESRVSGVVAGRDRKVDTVGRVQYLLGTLSKNHAIVSQGLSGPIDAGDQGASTGIESMTMIHALMPYGDRAYHLNPNIRSYLQDQLNQFSAFETLTRLSGSITKIRSLWQELNFLQSHGEDDDADRLGTSMMFAINELIFHIERNLMLLNAQISTDYGNVSSFTAKIRQNEFYAKQVRTMTRELTQVRRLLSSFEVEARGEHMSRVQQVFNASVSPRFIGWTARLNDVTFIISKKQFHSRILEARVLNLSRAALWLARNPTVNGVDLDLTLEMDPALLRPTRIRIRPQVDVKDLNPTVENAVRGILQRLPPPANPYRAADDEGTGKPRLLTRRGMPVIRETVTPVDQMLRDLFKSVATSDQPISVKSWQVQERQAAQIEEGAWMFYAATQLVAKKIRIQYQKAPRSPGSLNDVFSDVHAIPPKYRPPGTALAP